jgi:hypothetical protein
VFALNVMSTGPSLHQIGAVVAIITVACLFQNEINKFWWWPLHLAGWLLAVAFIPLLVGGSMRLLAMDQLDGRRDRTSGQTRPRLPRPRSRSR